LDVVPRFAALPAPVTAPAVVLVRPDVEAILSAAARTRPLPFAAVRAGDFPHLHFSLRQIEGIHFNFIISGTVLNLPIFRHFPFFPFFFLTIYYYSLFIYYI
jgi:hypothetical protein